MQSATTTFLINPTTKKPVPRDTWFFERRMIDVFQIFVDLAELDNWACN